MEFLCRVRTPALQLLLVDRGGRGASTWWGTKNLNLTTLKPDPKALNPTTLKTS